jgi:hypothetical protein
MGCPSAERVLFSALQCRAAQSLRWAFRYPSGCPVYSEYLRRARLCPDCVCPNQGELGQVIGSITIALWASAVGLA